MGRKKRAPFNSHPFAYHQEIELEITTLTNLGSGLGRIRIATPESDLGGSDSGWVVMVPFTLPGERVRARIFRNHRNFSEADLLEILIPSPHRIDAPCPLFGRCGGCQYQHLSYPQQLAWKQRQVAELLQHMAGVSFPVAPVVPSPRVFGYRSKITPHFSARRAADRSDFGVPSSAMEVPKGASDPPAAPNSKPQTPNPPPVDPPFPIGFLRQGTRFDIVDVPRCIIATEAINTRLGEVRRDIRTRAATGGFTRGATVLLREASGIVTTDYDAVITETIAAPAGRPPLKLHFLARDFFQNNPFILPAFTQYVREQAAAGGARFLVDAYCGSGLFALSAAPLFERVAGIEISDSSIRFARENAAANGITNATFETGDASQIFASLAAHSPAFAAADTAVIIDPPRKGCDEPFLQQLLAFGPRTVVYVSCDPATQMRDLRHFLDAGYALAAAQPFDLFPQTRHLECVLTLRRAAAA
ncbi:MAG: class I SAM-dependent RNA methyltransferase [Opitutus sp.]